MGIACAIRARDVSIPISILTAKASRIEAFQEAGNKRVSVRDRRIVSDQPLN